MLCARDISYLLVNNKLPVRERLFRVGLSTSAACTTCPGSIDCDVTHFFCSCLKVHDVWLSIKDIIIGFIGGPLMNHDIISYQFPSSCYDDEIVWLLSTYLEKIGES